jgi:hypothetical protein
MTVHRRHFIPSRIIARLLNFTLERTRWCHGPATSPWSENGHPSTDLEEEMLSSGYSQKGDLLCSGGR